MISIKKILVVVLVLLAGSEALASNCLGKKQAKRYIKQIVYNLFGSNHTSHTLHSMDKLVSSIKENVLSKSYKHGVFSSNRIYELTLSAVVNFIEHKSYKYALKQLKKVKDKKSKIAARISKTISDDVRRIVARRVWLENNVFSSFIGSKLREKVRGLVQKNTKQTHIKTHYEPVHVVTNPVVCYPDFYQPVNEIYPVPFYQTYMVSPVEVHRSTGLYIQQPNWGISFNFKA